MGRVGNFVRRNRRRPIGFLLLPGLCLYLGLFSHCVEDYPPDADILATLLGNGPAPELGAVQALYPASGSNWNDYVLADGTNFFNASDTPCAGTEMGSYRKCIHGGEKRFVEVKNRSSCGNIQARDNLGAFVWTCDASSGTVRMITGGLRDEKHLSDLIDWTASGFRPMQVTVTFTNNGKSTTTAASTWWNNPVVANPAAGPLVGAGTVYIFTANPAGSFDINANNIAFVGRPGVLITGSAAPGELLVRGLTQYFLWIEGDFDIADDSGINYNNVYFSVLRNLSKLAFINLYESGLENFFDSLNDSSITTNLSRTPYNISLIAKYKMDLSINSILEAFMSNDMILDSISFLFFSSESNDSENKLKSSFFDLCSSLN